MLPSYMEWSWLADDEIMKRSDGLASRILSDHAVISQNQVDNQLTKVH